jgi:hypothetical protein
MEKSPLAMLAISDTGFVFDPRTGHSYTVNSTGLALLRALKQGLSISAAQAEVEHAFECAGNIAGDVNRFVNALANNELIDNGTAQPTHKP